MKLYLPMTADLFHVGHLRAIRKITEDRDLCKNPVLMIGLLTDKAIEDYKGKPPVISYEQRKEILAAIKLRRGVMGITPQDSINPYENLKKFDIETVASGDGFEPEEINAIKKAGCKTYVVRLEGEKGGQKMFSTTAIKQKICKDYC